jgi:hypothetical protein
MVLSLDDLTTPLTSDDVKRAIYSVLAATGVDTTTWKPGGVVRTIISGVSFVGSALSQLIANLAKSGFLSTAAADWLGQLAINQFNVTPIAATFATGTVLFTNTSGGLYELDPGDLQVTNPTTKQSYFNTATVTIPPTTSNVPCAIQAFTIGSVGTSFAGEITEIQTSGLTGVTVTNPAGVVGTDAETDASIKLRCSDKLGSLSPNGPSDAYAFVARSAVRADQSSIGITRIRVTNDGFGNVNVYLATATGGITGTVGDLTTDLGVVDDLMQRLAAPLAVTLHTFTATPVVINVDYQLWMYNASGLTDDQIRITIENSLTSFVQNQPIGGNIIGTSPGQIYQSAIEATIGGSQTSQGVPLAPIKVVINTPVGDSAIDVNQVPVIGTMTGVRNQLKSPGL